MNTGIIRRIDNLGRVVIPKEIRRKFGVKEGDQLEIGVDDKSILFTPYHKTKNYIIDLVFYAGSDAKQDTDNKIIILKTDDDEVTQSSIIEEFRLVNTTLSNEENTLGFSYEEGINIYTLIEGYKALFQKEICEIKDFTGIIDGYCKVEVWQ